MRGSLQHSYLSLIEFNSIRIRTYIIGYIWAAISFSYYLSAYLFEFSHDPYQNVAYMGAFEAISYIISGYLCLNFE